MARRPFRMLRLREQVINLFPHFLLLYAIFVFRSIYRPVFLSSPQTSVWLTKIAQQKFTAQSLIQRHGNYRVLLNNCQVWASYLFNEITDVRGHMGMKISGVFARPLLAFYSAIF